MTKNRDSAHDEPKFIHINVGFNRWSGDYSCTALKVTKQHANYAHKNQYALRFLIGTTTYVVTSNFGITRIQAENLCLHHKTGHFKKEDTSNWD